MMAEVARAAPTAVDESIRERVLETGFQSHFQGFVHYSPFHVSGLQKKKLTRMREANIYNNMLCIIKTSAQE